MKAVIIIVTVLGVWALVMNIDFWANAPTPQQEAQDVSSDLRDARRQARELRRKEAIEAEMKRRGCK